jgi:hypothetical protein
MAKTTRLRRALRALNLFTLGTLNPPSNYESPHVGYANRPLSGPRVF